MSRCWTSFLKTQELAKGHWAMSSPRVQRRRALMTEVGSDRTKYTASFLGIDSSPNLDGVPRDHVSSENTANQQSAGADNMIAMKGLSHDLNLACLPLRRWAQDQKEPSLWLEHATAQSLNLAAILCQAFDAIHDPSALLQRQEKQIEELSVACTSRDEVIQSWKNRAGERKKEIEVLKGKLKEAEEKMTAVEKNRIDDLVKTNVNLGQMNESLKAEVAALTQREKELAVKLSNAEGYIQLWARRACSTKSRFLASKDYQVLLKDKEFEVLYDSVRAGTDCAMTALKQIGVVPDEGAPTPAAFDVESYEPICAALRESYMASFEDAEDLELELTELKNKRRRMMNGARTEFWSLPSVNLEEAPPAPEPMPEPAFSRSTVIEDDAEEQGDEAASAAV